MFGNELSSWNGTAFVAPVDGVYIFHLNMATSGNQRGYRIRAMINNGEVGRDHLMENTSRYLTNSNLGHSHSFTIQREMKVGDTLTIIDYYSYNSNSLNPYL